MLHSNWQLKNRDRERMSNLLYSRRLLMMVMTIKRIFYYLLNKHLLHGKYLFVYLLWNYSQSPHDIDPRILFNRLRWQLEACTAWGWREYRGYPWICFCNTETQPGWGSKLHEPVSLGYIMCSSPTELTGLFSFMSADNH